MSQKIIWISVREHYLLTEDFKEHRKMISYEHARKLVEAKINKPDPYSPYVRLVVLEDLTIERDWGWVFFYNTEAYLESGNFIDSLVGNAPYIFNRFTAELIETGTAEEIEHYIKAYEETLA